MTSSNIVIELPNSRAINLPRSLKKKVTINYRRWGVKLLRTFYDSWTIFMGLRKQNSERELTRRKGR